MPEKEGCFHSLKTLQIMNDEQGILKLLWNTHEGSPEEIC